MVINMKDERQISIFMEFAVKLFIKGFNPFSTVGDHFRITNE